MTRSRMMVAALLIAVPLLAAACSEGPNLPEGGQTATESATPVPHPGAIVNLQYSSFEPSIVTIKAGQTVEWQWLDSPVPHDVYFQEYFPPSAGAAPSAPVQIPYHSAIMVTGTWYHTFTLPGTYYYVCTVHAGMFGKVIVNPANGGPTIG